LGRWGRLRSNQPDRSRAIGVVARPFVAGLIVGLSGLATSSKAAHYRLFESADIKVFILP
ncbi:MAG: hypothetical protein ACREC5_04020, partial [Thermoplasmata archaeon]